MCETANATPAALLDFDVCLYAPGVLYLGHPAHFGTLEEAPVLSVQRHRVDVGADPAPQGRLKRVQPPPRPQARCRRRACRPAPACPPRLGPSSFTPSSLFKTLRIQLCSAGFSPSLLTASPGKTSSTDNTYMFKHVELPRQWVIPNAVNFRCTVRHAVVPT
jgi:hypothetical protein